MENEIRVWRARRGWSQTVLAMKVGMGRDRLLRIEKGYTKPSPKEKVDIAAAFGAEVRDVFPRHREAVA